MSLAALSQQRRSLGCSGIRVPLLGFGAAPIGNLYRPVPAEEAHRAVRSALDLGFKYFDTAPYYGFGLSESRLGFELARGGAEDVVLSTKVGRLLRPLAPSGEAPKSVRHGFADTPDLEPLFDYSYDGVMRSFEESLGRLQCPQLGLLYAHDLGAVVHRSEHRRQWKIFTEGGYRALCELKRAGLVDAIGLGTNEWQVCEQALDELELDVFLLAGRYTLLEQGACHSFLPRCARAGVSVVLGGPFNSGILATGVGERHSGQHYYNYEPAPATIVERVAALEAVCEAFAVPLAAAALQFPAAHPQIASVVAGLASEAQVQQAKTWMDWPIPEAFWQCLLERNLIDELAPLPPYPAAAGGFEIKY